MILSEKLWNIRQRNQNTIVEILSLTFKKKTYQMEECEIMQLKLR